MFVWVATVQKIDVLEGIDINKTGASKECILCHYWHFKDLGFKFEPAACNKCHDVLMTGYKLKKHCNIECKRCWLQMYFMGY